MPIVGYVGDRGVDHLLREQVALHPDRLFLLYEDAMGRTFQASYAEFETLVNRVGHSLAERGIRPGNRVALSVGNCPEYVIAWWAIARLGAVSVPCSPTWAPDELEYALGLTEPEALILEHQVLVAYRDASGRLPNVDRIVVCRRPEADAPIEAVPWEELLGGSSESLEWAPSHAADVAELLFTSGSTARPRAAMFTHANLLLDGERWSLHLGMSGADRVMCPYPIYHNNAQCVSMLAAVTVGAELLLLERFSASRYVSQVRRYRPTIMTILPPIIRSVLAQPDLPGDLRGIFRTMLLGPAITPDEQATWERLFGIRLQRGYGQTETLTGIAISNLHGYLPTGAIGRPALYREVKIVDDAGREVPAGQPGEILVSAQPGVTVMLGYFRDEASTKQTIQDGWLRTGDIGFVDAEGFLYFLERKKDLIKPRGYSVSPGEVERVILEHPAVAECAAFGIPDPMREERVAVAVVCRPGQKLVADELQELCRKKLAAYKVPEHVWLLDAIPRNVSDKPDRRGLRERFLALQRPCAEALVSGVSVQ